VRIRAPLPTPRLRRVIDGLLRASGYKEARIYVQVTRGVAARQHAFPRRTKPTLVVYVEKAPARRQPGPGAGVAAITVNDPRARRCDIKAIALLPNVLAKQAAIEAGVREAIFIGPHGTVREGSTANVFAVWDGVIWTHPLGPEILPGVSRAVVLDLARSAGVRVREMHFTRSRLYTADEVFLSSTMQEVAPIVRIDGRKIGNGRPGPVATLLWHRFHARTLEHGRHVRMRIANHAAGKSSAGRGRKGRRVVPSAGAGRLEPVRRPRRVAAAAPKR